MTKKEIIEMAHKSGLHLATDVNWMPIIGLEYLEKFSKLVAEKEREQCAQIADEWVLAYPHPSKVIAEQIRARGQNNG
jgi:hypothetical protein